MSYRPLAAWLIVLAAACNQKPQTDYRLNQAPLIYEDPEPEIINTKWGPMTRAEYNDELRRRRRMEEAEQTRVQENPVPQPPVAPQPPAVPDPDIGEKLVSEQQKKSTPQPPPYVPDPVSTSTTRSATKR